MNFQSKFGRWTNKRSTRFIVTLTVLFGVSLVSLFEYLKRLLHEGITLNESGMYSVIFVGVLVGLIAFYVKRREDQFARTQRELSQHFSESNERFKKLMHHIPGMAYQFKKKADGGYCVPFASEGIVNLFGCTPEDVVDSFAPIASVILEEDRVKVMHMIEYSALHLSVWQHEYRVRLPGGSIKWLLGHASPERLPDGTLLWHGYVSDITKYRLAGEERAKLQRLESVGVLAGGIAHDFNNLLAAIMGSASVGAIKADQPTLKKIFAAIINASKKAASLTQLLLGLAKGGIPGVKKSKVRDVVMESSGFILGTNSACRCELHLPEDLWMVAMDSLQISQIIQNLVINASHAMPGGGVIDISAKNVETDSALEGKKSFVEVAIADSGIGISEENLLKIFDPYFTTKKDGLGSGLGLSVVHSILEKNGGKVTVESTIGEGTVFRVCLPALTDEALAIREMETDDAMQRCGYFKVLLMDDDELVQEVVGEMLSMLGHDYAVASDGGEAITLYLAARGSGIPFDLVILDLTVPGGMGGEETFAILKEVNPDINAIVSSGYSDKVPTGFRAILPKPYEVATLEKVICEVTRSRVRLKDER